MPDPIPNPKDYEGKHTPMISRTTERAATTPSSPTSEYREGNPSISPKQFADGISTPTYREMAEAANPYVKHPPTTLDDLRAAARKQFIGEEGEAKLQEIASRPDMVNHPPHYSSHPSGVECIDIVRWFNFNRGNAMKYIWRAGEKGDPYFQEIEDLKKAVWYLNDEIERVTVAEMDRRRAEGT